MSLPLAPLLLSLVCMSCQDPDELDSPRPEHGEYPRTVDWVLSGTVVTVEGAPVEGARVSPRLRNEVAQPEDEVATGPDGRFELPFGRRGLTVDLVVEADGFAPSRIDRVHLPPPSYDLGSIVVHEPVLLRGSVVGPDGAPIGNARVHAAQGRVVYPRPEFADGTVVATTGADGVFVTRSLPPGIVTLGAGAEGFADRVLEPRALGRDGNAPVELRLRREFPVEIRVSGVDGRPCPDAVARVLEEGALPSRRSGHGALGFWRSSWPADPDGRIRIDGYDGESRRRLIVEASGYQPRDGTLRGKGHVVAVALRPTTRLDLRLTRPAGPRPELFSVRLRAGTFEESWPDGLAECGSAEELYWLELEADSPPVTVLAPDRWRIEWDGSEGRCLFPDLPGEVEVCTREGIRARRPLGDVVEGRTAERRIEVPRPTRLSGFVRDHEGNPLSARLGAQQPYRGTPLVATSAVNGAFDFPRLGTYARVVSLDPAWVVANGESIQLSSGEWRRGYRVTLRPRRPRPVRAFHGRVRIDGRAPGRPYLFALHHATATAIHRRLPIEHSLGMAWCDAAGRLRIESSPDIDVSNEAMHVVPRHALDPGVGWWDFSAAFPPHGEGWPKTIPSRLSIDLPPEEEWDTLSPPPESSERWPFR